MWPVVLTASRPNYRHQTTRWNRMPLERLTVSQLVKFPVFYGTQRFITAFTRARLLSISWATLTQSIFPSHILNILFNIILSFTSRYFKWFFPSGFPNNTLCTPLPHAYCMPRQSNSSRFNHRNVWCGVRITKLISM